jgi:N-acetylmuramoyl-L-alanine amidase
MKTPPIIILDPGHGMANKAAGRYDSGAVAAGVEEADVVMDWANELRAILRSRKVPVIRTRFDLMDPAPIGQRAAIARRYKGEVMVSLHCNSTPGASGTETFYRGAENRAKATQLNLAVVKALGTRNRGAKTEQESQHATLAVMAFQPCFLIELGFIDHPGDRAKMLDPNLRRKACEAIADVVLSWFPDR